MFMGSTADQLRWTLQLNPTLSAPLTYTSGTNSAVMEANGNGTITVTSPGTIIAGGAFSSSIPDVVSQINNNFNAWLGNQLNNTTDELVLCGTPITTSLNAYGGMATKEFG